MIFQLPLIITDTHYCANRSVMADNFFLLLGCIILLELVTSAKLKCFEQCNSNFYYLFAWKLNRDIFIKRSWAKRTVRQNEKEVSTSRSKRIGYRQLYCVINRKKACLARKECTCLRGVCRRLRQKADYTYVYTFENRLAHRATSRSK